MKIRWKRRDKKRLAASAGSFAITGTAATLTYSGVGDTQEVTWNQVTGNEGYRIEWDTVSHPTEETAYADNDTVATDVTSYEITTEASTTYYWRVASLVDGVVQNWSAEDTFTT